MSNHNQYYYGSYGLIRGYGMLCRTYEEADDSVLVDHRMQRRHGGTTDRNAVVVTRDTGLCWWFDESDMREGDMVPVKTPSGAQAQYSLDTIRNYEGLWGGPEETAGFG